MEPTQQTDACGSPTTTSNGDPIYTSTNEPNYTIGNWGEHNPV